jgi:hypothetical protein
MEYNEMAVKKRKSRKSSPVYALQYVNIAHFREDSRAVILRQKAKVRGMVVKGMGKSVFRIIPLTIIPLTFLRRFPTAISPSSLWLRRAALGLLRLISGYSLQPVCGLCNGLLSICVRIQVGVRERQSGAGARPKTCRQAGSAMGTRSVVECGTPVPLCLSAWRSWGNWKNFVSHPSAASMLHFQEHGGFADYFGSRWHYDLGAIIAAIPVPHLAKASLKAEWRQRYCVSLRKTRIWMRRGKRT